MFEVSVEKATNTLKLSYAGRVEAAEAQRCAQEIHSLLGQLQPGFSFLSDLSALEEMDLACVSSIEKVMDWCNDAGIKMVVRIVPDPRKDIGLNILSLFHYRRGVRIVTCSTLKEAESVLAG